MSRGRGPGPTRDSVPIRLRFGSDPAPIRFRSGSDPVPIRFRAGSLLGPWYRLKQSAELNAQLGSLHLQPRLGSGALVSKPRVRLPARAHHGGSCQRPRWRGGARISVQLRDAWKGCGLRGARRRMPVGARVCGACGARGACGACVARRLSLASHGARRMPLGTWARGTGMRAVCVRPHSLYQIRRRDPPRPTIACGRAALATPAPSLPLRGCERAVAGRHPPPPRPLPRRSRSPPLAAACTPQSPWTIAPSVDSATPYAAALPAGRATHAPRTHHAHQARTGSCR